MHLTDYKVFKKVLPSRVFEYAAMGKPISVSLCGFAAEFIECYVENSEVFQSCDVLCPFDHKMDTYSFP